MIKFVNAAEAAEIAEMAFVVPEYLKQRVHDKIMKAAQEGKRSVLLTGITELFNGVYEFEKFVITKDQESVLRLLRENLFEAEFVADGDSYMPRGVQDDGTGRSYRNYYIDVKW